MMTLISNDEFDKVYLITADFMDRIYNWLAIYSWHFTSIALYALQLECLAYVIPSAGRQIFSVYNCP